LHIIEHVSIILARYEGDGDSLGSESTGSSYSVEVLIRLVWHVEVDDNVDLFNVDSSSQQISGDHDSVLDVFEIVVDLESLLHGQVFEASATWEFLSNKDVVQFLSILLCFSEDDHLVELSVVEDIDQLLDLFVLFELHKVLLKTMQVELGLTLYNELKWLLHVESTRLFGLIG